MRGDGAEILVGEDVTFLERSTVHVASDFMGSYIGDYSIVGRFALVHACKIGKSVIIGDQAIIMDGSDIGDNCIINTKSILEHDSNIGNHCHISTNAVINGGVFVGNGSFIGKIKEDQIGKFLQEDMVREGLKFPLGFTSPDVSTGCCTIFVEEDGTRTMCTYLGAGTLISPDDIKEEDIKIIDARKPFEYQVGTFKGAKNPNVNHFRNFPKYLTK